MSVALRVPVLDASGDIVKSRFMDFLQTYREEVDGDNVNAVQKLAVDYMLQMATMMQNNKSTVYVNFKHVLEADHELAEAIEIEYYRFEPYLRAAVQDCIAKDNQHYVMDVDRGQREFFVSFYNMTRVERIRGLRTEKIGRLLSMSGTVTRSTEVRPELLYGAFTCTKCGTVHPSVEQQFQYTEPQVCKNPQCAKGEFHLNLTQCAFVDWQMLKVQENADEIPAGSMPRTLEVPVFTPFDSHVHRVHLLMSIVCAGAGDLPKRGGGGGESRRQGGVHRHGGGGARHEWLGHGGGGHPRGQRRGPPGGHGRRRHGVEKTRRP